MAKRHVKPNPIGAEPGGIVDKEMPTPTSSNLHGRVPRLRRSHPRGYRYAEDGKKIRFCKKCNETL